MITADELLACDWPFQFATDPDGQRFSGGCPCASIVGDGFIVSMHCWRSSCDADCEFAGVHVSGSIDDETKRRIGEHVRDNNGWTKHTEWAVVVQ